MGDGRLTGVTRVDGRSPGALRPVLMTPDYVRNSDASVLVDWGGTKILCTANWSDMVPLFAKERGRGWLTAEYGMLPGSTSGRTDRERRGPSGRTAEIQRIVARSLRAVVDLGALKDRALLLDCDVLQADGGTRCASVTGGFVAASIAVNRAVAAGRLRAQPWKANVAAVSVGILGLDVLLDLCYVEDSQADVDLNVILTDKGDYVEIQGTAEARPFSEAQLQEMLALARAGAPAIFAEQKRAIAAAKPS